jgi:hypothetical protein
MLVPATLGLIAGTTESSECRIGPIGVKSVSNRPTAGGKCSALVANSPPIRGLSESEGLDVCGSQLGQVAKIFPHWKREGKIDSFKFSF